MDDENRRKLALLLGIAETLRVFPGAMHPEAPAQSLPRRGAERVSALQLALESLLFAALLAPGLTGRACVAVAIQAVQLAAWVVWWRAKQHHEGRL